LQIPIKTFIISKKPYFMLTLFQWLFFILTILITSPIYYLYYFPFSKISQFFEHFHQIKNFFE